MAELPSNVADAKGKVDIGIITIREDEFEAVLAQLSVEQLLAGRQRYAFSRVKTAAEDEYLIASVRCLEPGTGQAQEVARTMIDELDPQWILLIGIAGSMPHDEYTLGDVILASRVHDFSVSAAIEIGDGRVQEFALGGGPMHPEIQTLLANLPALNMFLADWSSESVLGVARPSVKLAATNFYGDESWKKRVRASLRRYFRGERIRDYPKALVGSMASSGTLVKDTQLAEQWLKTSRDIRAIEMELAGVYQAAWGSNKPVLAIRGISDVVGFRRCPEWTAYACRTAACFALALLRSRPLPSCESRLLEATSVDGAFNQRVGVFKQKPPSPAAARKHERLYSNLLEVIDIPKTIYAVQTACKDDKAVWAILNQQTSEPPSDWIIRSKTLYAFHDFHDVVWKKVCNQSEVEPHQTAHWSHSEDTDRKNEFIDLLTNCLKQFGKSKDLRFVNKAWVSGEKRKFRYFHYTATDEYAGRPYFKIEDFLDAGAMIERLTNGSELSKYILGKFPRKIQEWLRKYDVASNTDWNRLLVEGFNRILSISFFNRKKFKDIFFRHDVKVLSEGGGLKAQKLAHFNRMVVEDIYRKIIVRRELVPRRVVITSLVREAPTRVFGAYRSRTGQLSYYRHHAFRPQFLSIGRKWYLEITPTYHYTHDGYRVCFFYEDLIRGIKRIEGSGAVFRQVMFWARMLQDRKGSLLQPEPYPFLQFGQLVEFDFEYGVAAQRSEARKAKTVTVSGQLFQINEN
jgi:nucleoside phosphorylase